MRRRAGSTLERRLPLAIALLLAVVVGIYCLATYREVRSTSIRAETEHLQSVTRQLADLSTAALQQRDAALRTLAADTAVRRAIREGKGVGGLDLALAKIRQPADSTLAGWVFRSADNKTALRLGQAPTAADERQLAALAGRAMRGDSILRSPLYVDGGRVMTLTVVPVREEGRTTGYFADRRWVANSPRAERQIADLIGGEVEVYIVSPATGVWTNLRGQSLQPLMDLANVGPSFGVRRRDGVNVLGAQSFVRSGSYGFVLMATEQKVFERPRAFLRRILFIGLALLAIGALAAWALSRRVTRPLVDLTNAAEAVTGGDFSQRVSTTRTDELGRLAQTFNTMAEEVGRSVSRTGRLQGVTAALSSVLSLDDAITVVLRQGVAAAGAQAGTLCLLEPGRPMLRLMRAEGYDDDIAAGFSDIPLDAPMPIAEAARTGTPVFVESSDGWQERFGRTLPVTKSRSWVALPMLAHDRVIGVVGLSFHVPQHFDRETRALLMSLAQQFAQAIDRAMLFEEAVREREAAEAARLEAQRANEAKTSFLAMMSHELRTPLNAIAGYTELIELGLRGPVTSEQRLDLGRIRRNGQHLLTLINEILNLSRIEAGQLTVTLEPVNIDETLREVEALMGPELLAKGLRYEAGACAATAVVIADAEKLRQVFINLLSNALRFTDTGGRVRTNCVIDGDEVHVEVHDTGIGIPADKLDAIFEPFVQADASLTRKMGGTGLGLAISRRLVDAMGGRISVESVVARGSTFTVTLPRTTATPDSHEQNASTASVQLD